VNVKYSSFVLSGISQFGGFVSAGALSPFVLLLAPLALRNFRCIKYRALSHNKGKQYAPSAPDVASLRRCCWR
jgi:hypothetical protein